MHSILLFSIQDFSAPYGIYQVLQYVEVLGDKLNSTEQFLGWFVLHGSICSHFSRALRHAIAKMG